MFIFSIDDINKAYLLIVILFMSFVIYCLEYVQIKHDIPIFMKYICLVKMVLLLNRKDCLKSF